MQKLLLIVVLMFAIGCSDRDDNVSVKTQPEYSANLLTKYSGSQPVGKQFLFKPTKKGYYAIDVWLHMHRAEDMLAKRLHLHVEQLPYTENIVVPSNTHRVEVKFSISPIIASTISFPDHELN